MFEGSKDGLFSQVFDLHAGQYSMLKIRMSGTAQAGKTAVITNFGMITLMRKGGQRYSIDISQLSKITNLMMGEIESTSAAGAAFAFTVMCPFRGFKDKNVLNVENDGDLKLIWPAASGGAVVFASLAVELSGVEEMGVQLYEPMMWTITPTLAGGDIPTLPGGNIIYIGLNAPATTNPSMVTLEVDKVVKKMDSFASLLAETNAISQIESSTESMAILNLNPTGNVLEVVGHSYKLTEVGGVGAQTIIVFGAEFDVAAAVRSQQKVAVQAGRSIAIEPGTVAVQGPISAGVKIVKGPTTPGFGVI